MHIENNASPLKYASAKFNATVKKAPHAHRLRPFGNSRGIVIPKPLLMQLGLEDTAEVRVENDALVIRKAAQAARAGWGDAAKALAQANDFAKASRAV